MSWKKTFINTSSTIRDAIKSLNSSSMRICMLVDERQALLGTISDGDIRRGILRGLSLDSNVMNIIRKDPIVCNSEIPLEDVENMMRESGILQVPIVDNQNVVCGMHNLVDLDKKKFADQNQLMIIMAGGEGTRLLPFTEHCPKPMLHVNGKPMIERIINNAKEQGFGRFIISVNYLAHLITDYLGNGERLGVEISYTHENKPLGTVGSLSLILEKVHEPFVLTNGDVLSDVNYSNLLDFHQQNDADATMCVCEYELHNPFGVVRTNGIRIEGFEEKPIHHSLINAGVYAFNAETLKYLKYNEYCDIPTLFTRLADVGKTSLAYLVHEKWRDVGRPEDLNAANSNDTK